MSEATDLEMALAEVDRLRRERDEARADVEVNNRRVEHFRKRAEKAEAELKDQRAWHFQEHKDRIRDTNYLSNRLAVAEAEQDKLQKKVETLEDLYVGSSKVAANHRKRAERAEAVLRRVQRILNYGNVEDADALVALRVINEALEVVDGA